jgi:hypothetical protein
VQDLTAQQARERPWKLDSIRHLLQNNNWTGTKVEFQMRGKKLAIHSVILTRLDGWSFPLIKSAHLLYVIFTDDGLELAHIESVSCAAADGKNQKKARKILIKYSRVFRTEKAIELCESEDHHSKTSHGIRRVSSLGAKSLRKLLEQENSESNARLVFHRGDFPFETSAENVVGFVAWKSACDGVDGASINDDSKAFLAQINNSLRMPSGTIQLKLANLSEFDTVYLGQDFSEHAPEKD